MTGVITDLRVELGNWIHGDVPRRANGNRVANGGSGTPELFATILELFVGGGVVDAIAFAVLGFAATVPFAAILVTLAAPPMLQDRRSMGDECTG